MKNFINQSLHFGSKTIFIFCNKTNWNALLAQCIWWPINYMSVPLKQYNHIINWISAEATGHRYEIRFVVKGADTDHYGKCGCDERRSSTHQYLGHNSIDNGILGGCFSLYLQATFCCFLGILLPLLFPENMGINVSLIRQAEKT